MTMTNFRRFRVLPWLVVGLLWMPLMAGAAPRAWTFMVYMAADNDLEKASLIDVNEMEAVGSTKDVAIVVQLDRSKGFSADDGDWAGARRFLIQRDADPKSIRSPVLANLGDIDSGRGSSLVAFVRDAVKRYPAQRYALVIWSHGTGWQALSGYSSIDETGPADPGATSVRAFAAQATSGSIPAAVSTRAPSVPPLPAARVPDPPGAPTGARSPESEIQADIAFDDARSSAISIAELAESLREIMKVTGRPLDLLGFDACMMQNIEIATELAPMARAIVGSEETMSARGWPYFHVLSTLVRRPSMDGRHLGATVPAVTGKVYENARGPTNALTITAIDTALAANVIKAASDVGYYLYYWSKARPEVVAVLRERVQTFTNNDYVDLFHLARLAKTTFKCPNTARACDRLLSFQAVAGTAGSPGLILGHSTNQTRVANANGLSVYFPTRRTNAFDRYRTLWFAKATWWDEFVAAWLENRPASVTVKSRKPRGKARREPLADVSTCGLLQDVADELTRTWPPGGIRAAAAGGDAVVTVDASGTAPAAGMTGVGAYRRASSAAASLVDAVIGLDDLTGIEEFLRGLRPLDDGRRIVLKPLLAALESRLTFFAVQEGDAHARDLLRLLRD